MSDKSAPRQGVMVGGGAYNQHSSLQAAGAAFALSLLEKAVLNVAVEPGSHPVVIADYGSSEGKNSLAPMRSAVEGLRSRIGPDRPIFIFHIDQSANDFNSLFRVLDTDPATYAHAPNVFSCAVGRSFYEQVLPYDYVHLGWSSYAAQWFSKVPRMVPDHIHPAFASGAARAEFDRQGAEDWETWLSLRASELRQGGRLAVVLPALDDQGNWDFASFMSGANEVLADMVKDGSIEADERSRMIVGVQLRRRRDLLSPFERLGHFRQLKVESCDLHEVRDTAWDDYERDHNANTWANHHARFFQSTFAPSLMTGLTDAGDREKCRAFADQLAHRLKQHLMKHPAPLRSFVQTMLLAKQ